VPAARKELDRKLQALTDYRSVQVAGSAADTPAAGSRSGGAASFGATGLVDVSRADVDFSEKPILDGFNRGGASSTDYRWAAETWENVVRPRVLAGDTREDFEALDAERGRFSGFRRTAGVYDVFLGSDPIHFERRADGTLGVADGRHRVQMARSLGITHLPGVIDG
jgi:hypothetical protein